MANMNHCRACRRPYFLHEAACPFCGVQAPGGRMGRYVRRAKVGGLMLFTALTTAACYGSPPPPGTIPRNLKPAAEQPLAKMPTRPGTAYLFVTPKGKAKTGATLQLEKALLEGTALKVNTAPLPDSALPVSEFFMSIEAAEVAAFQAPGKNEAFQPLPVEKMKLLQMAVPYADEKGRTVNLEVSVPGSTGAQGVLQLSRLDDDAVGGVLRIDYADTTVELYFLAAR